MTTSNNFELGVETLERRELLAGNVAVGFTPAGDFFVRGDGASNSVSVVVNVNGVFVAGRDFESINGGPPGGVAGFASTNGTRSMKISLGAGNDYLTLEGATPGREIRINSGSGNDLVSLRNANVGRNLRVTTGSGIDAISMVNVAVGSNAILNTGGNDDLVGFACVVVGGAMRVSTASGNDAVVGTKVGVGTLLTNTGSGDDVVAMDQTVVLGNFHCRLGSGNDAVAMGSGTTVNGAWQYFGGSGVDQALGRGVIYRQMEGIDPSLLNADGFVQTAGQVYVLAWVVAGGNLADLVGCP